MNPFDLNFEEGIITGIGILVILFKYF